VLFGGLVYNFIAVPKLLHKQTLAGMAKETAPD
jgi:hypothetical protein